MKLFAIITAAVLCVTAWAQQAAFLTNSIAWDPSPSAGVTSYVLTLTTNRVAFGTNGYVPPASAIIASNSTPQTQMALLNLWPGLTNGVYSVFAQANASGFSSVTSSNIVINVIIPPLPVRNLRLQ
jgi:hypothetical protein